MRTVTLSTGETVHMQDRFTHAMHKALFSALNKGVVWKQDAETGEYKKELPAENIEFQYEAVMPLLIVRIEKDGKPVNYSPGWLDELIQPDFQLLEDAATEIRAGKVAKNEAGEVITDAAGKKKV